MTSLSMATVSRSKFFVRIILFAGLSFLSFELLAFGKPPVDTDSDGVVDTSDQCPLTIEGLSVDEFGCADNQKDSDNDGVDNSLDQCKQTDEGLGVDNTGCSFNQLDNDNDGLLNGVDDDDDNDGILDIDDELPNNANESLDTDLDGIGNNADDDDDNDGYTDAFELANETDPLNIDSRPGTKRNSTRTSLVPKTNRNISYAPLDDADLRKGIEVKYERDPYKEIVYDRTNNLAWQDLIDSVELRLTHRKAQQYCWDSIHGGITNWRLPTANELFFLYAFSPETGDFNNAHQVFKYTNRSEVYLKAYSYWVNRTVLGPVTEEANSVNFHNMGVHERNKDSATNVRCVSGTESFHRVGRRLHDSLELKVDTSTQLMWHDYDEYLERMTWPAALEYCENLDIYGLSDWRLPNLFESQTVDLVSYAKYGRFSRVTGRYEGWWTSHTTETGSMRRHEGPSLASSPIQNTLAGAEGLTRCVRDYHEPVAIVSGNKIIEYGDSLTVTANQSYISDGEIAEYTWYDKYWREVSEQASLTIQSHNKILGAHAFHLKIIDQFGVDTKHTFYVYVLDSDIENIPPVANAGDDKEVEHGNYVGFTARGSWDSDGIIATYEWSENGVILGNQKILPELKFSSGIHTVQLKVTDNRGLSGFDEVQLIVTEKPLSESLSQCPNISIRDDRDFLDNYPKENIEWVGSNFHSVIEIEKSFNHARKIDSTVYQYLKLPTPYEWNSMSMQLQGLYLINAERQARGLKPFEGISSEVVAVIQTYVDYILSNNAVIDHYLDASSPSQRLDANSSISNLRDEHISNENLASSYGTASLLTEKEYLVEAIYSWIYADKFPLSGASWDHRSLLLQVGLNENSGVDSAEGLIGFGVSIGGYNPENLKENIQGGVVGINLIDQSASWDTSNIETVNIDEAQLCNNLIAVTINEKAFDTQLLSSIRIEAKDLFLTLGSTGSIAVTAIYEDGTELDITNSARYEAVEGAIVSVVVGKVTGLHIGQATIYAKTRLLSSNRLQVTVGEISNLTDLATIENSSIISYVPSNLTSRKLDPKALAVYTGLATDKLGGALTDVQVSFVNQPELGSVKTNINGRFIIAGPAGLQTLVYEKLGHLTVQREGTGASNSWFSLEEVILLPFDTKRSFINITSGAMQVHESSVITDEFGSRKATVIFDDITSATVYSADGYVRELRKFWFSATEYEVPKSMPGPLPSDSVFTYCSKLNIEGTRYNDTVIFDNNVVMFVDNFLGFEVGEIIPIGYFDMINSNWVASDNGVVVRLLDQDSNGVVDGLDYTGDGIADDLDKDGNTDDEARGLVSYSAGDTLWWGTFNHFTATDYNFSGSKEDDNRTLDQLIGIEDPENNEKSCVGSYVQPYQQSFHEDIVLAGMDIELHYSSQRTEGYNHKVNIKVSGEAIPGNLLNMTARLEIAGNVYEQTFAPEENVSAEFIWDGLDASGERPAGMVSGRIRVGYEYASEYLSTGNAVVDTKSLNEYDVAWDVAGNRNTNVIGREKFTSWQSRGISLKNSFDHQIAKGWSFSNVHEIDYKGLVYLGNGSTMEVSPQSLILKTGLTFSVVDGDDGYYQAGGSDIDYQFTDESTLIDKVTGLEWQISEGAFEANNLSDATQYCSEQSIASGKNWRLPTIKERTYMIDKSGMLATSDLFKFTSFTEFWFENSAAPYSKLKPVVCVNGQNLDITNVEGLARDSVEQVVVDGKNGLMWQDSSANISQTYTWEGGIEYCENLSHGGFSDWRLPNINELLYILPNSIFEHQTELVVPEGQYWSRDASFKKPYWSSTTNNQYEPYAWAIESISYNDSYFNKLDEYNVRCIRNDGSSSRTPYKFDSEGKHVATIDLDSGKTLTEFQYDQAGKLSAMVDQFGNTITINRDFEGTVTSVESSDGQVTDINIDAENNLYRTGYEDNSEFLFYYDKSLLEEKIDRNGKSFKHYFDENGRVYQTNDPEGGQWDFFDNKLSYNENYYGYTTAEGETYETTRSILMTGDVQKVTILKDGSQVTHIQQSDDLKETILSNGMTTVIDKVVDAKTKDKIPHIITITQPSGLANSTTIDKTYGAQGADTSQYTVTMLSNGRESSVVSESKLGTVVASSPEGRIVTYASDPTTLLLDRVTTSGLLDTTYLYDSRGRTTHITTGDRTTEYVYDDANPKVRGNVESIIAADGQVTRFEYDELDRIEKTTYHDGHSTATTYDKNGNAETLLVPTQVTHNFSANGVNKIETNTTPLNEVTRYRYDNDRRLQEIELPSGQLITNNYTSGQLRKTTTVEGDIDYTYLNGSKPETITEGTGSNTETLTYGYDGDLVTSIQYAGIINTNIVQGYDNNFWLDSLTYAGSTTPLNYDNDGLLTGINGYTIARHTSHGLPENISDGISVQSRTYSTYGETDTVQNRINDKRSYDYSLDYNLVGQIDGKTETLADGTSNTYVYHYDDKRRLTSVVKNGSTIESYAYDANGNRKLQTVDARGIDAQAASYNIGDQLEANGNTSFEYDTNGRLSKKTTTTGIEPNVETIIEEYSYSSLGRLLSATVDGKNISYQHNALGNRVAKLVNGEVTEKYLWLNKTSLAAIYDKDDNLVQRFEYGLSNTPVSFTQDANKYYITSDHLGSPRTISDASGNTLKAIDYDSFGNVIEDTNPALEIPFGFAGGLHDKDTNLIRFGYRDFDPETGRWTARDPIGFAGGDTNLYGYVASNPINFIDSNGLLAEDFYVAEAMMGEIFIGQNIPTITSCDHCKVLEPLNEGAYDSVENKITINEYDFRAGNLWNDTLTNSEAKALLSTHIHEMIHANQNWLSQAIIKFLSNNSGDGLGDRLHAHIEKMASILADRYANEYNERRKEAAGCD